MTVEQVQKQLEEVYKGDIVPHLQESGTFYFMWYNEAFLPQNMMIAVKRDTGRVFTSLYPLVQNFDNWQEDCWKVKL